MAENAFSFSARACFLCGGDVENFASLDGDDDDDGTDSDLDRAWESWDQYADSDNEPDPLDRHADSESDADSDYGNIPNSPSGGSSDAPAGPSDAPAGPNDPSDGRRGRSPRPRRRDAWMKYFRLIYTLKIENHSHVHRCLPDEVVLSWLGCKSVGGLEGLPYTAQRVRRSTQGDRQVHTSIHPDDRLIIHQACLEVLLDVYAESDDGSPPFPRLWEVVSNMPTYDALVPSWGHEYSLKPVRKHYYHQYPWRISDIRGQLARPGRLRASPRRKEAADEFASLLAAAPTAPDREPYVFSSVDYSRDAFFRLPAEIRLQIGILLSVDDVLALRLASKAFSFLLHDQQFWASRFHLPHGERTWLLDAEELLMKGDRQLSPKNDGRLSPVSRAITTGRGVVDWESLFRLTRGASSLGNFWRVRVLAEKLQEILDMEFMVEPAVPVFPYGIMAYGQPMAAPSIAGSLKQRLDRIDWAFQPCVGELEDVGPQNQPTRIVYLPADIAHMTFYFVTLGDERYLTGMMILARSTDEIVRMGYENLGDYEELDVEGEFCGFVLAVGSRGIQGLRCVDGEGHAVGDWVGLDTWPAHELPVTERLVCRAGTKILAMKALFDGLRCIELSVASEHTVRIFEDKPYEYDDGAFAIMPNAVWYPALIIDEQEEEAEDVLHVWDEHALHAGRLCQGFKPLTWILFAGWDGSALRHITSMSVLLHGRFSPRQFTIKFSYDDAYDVDGETRERHAILSTRATGSPELEDGIEEFAIDGAGGEFITNVGTIMHFSDGYVHSAYRRRDFELNGFPVGIEVKTNRARSHAFTVKNDVLRSSPPETYYFAPTVNETPIVGLYAGETSPTMGFQLGVLGLGIKNPGLRAPRLADDAVGLIESGLQETGLGQDARD